MTQQSSIHSSASVKLQSSTGRVWDFSVLRPLSPTIRVVRSSDGATYALKTIPLPSEHARATVLREAQVWLHASECPSILRLHDCCVTATTAYFIVEYCPGGILTVPRTERSALRTIATLTAALQFLIDSVQQPVHANISATHVLFDASGAPKLGGFGLVRAKRLSNTKRKLSEKDDVRALTALLYELCYGERFDTSKPSFPKSSNVSNLTRQLLRSVLLASPPKLPDLLAFRYDLAAARQLVPPCTPPLKPIVNTRAQENLELDINSNRGMLPPTSLVSENSSSSLVQTSTPSQASAAVPTASSSLSLPPPPTSEPPAKGAVQGQDLTQLDSVEGVSAIIQRIANSSLSSIPNDDVDRILEACVQLKQLPDRVFESLGQLHISSSKGNPIIAFKVVTFIHRLMAEGPATLTSSALQKIDFLRWIETSWSRARISNHSGKVHPYTYCFATGEISWYANMLSRRALVHGTYALVFSTSWMARVNGLSSLSSNRREAFRSVLDLLERCGAIVRKVITAKDPAASVKQYAVPFLIREICKTYYSLCWLYATAPEKMKELLKNELEVGHTAARNANNAVRTVPDVAVRCAPECLLTLEEKVPQDFNSAALVSLLKKLKKRKKKKASGRSDVATTDEASNITPGRDPKKSAETTLATEKEVEEEEEVKSESVSIGDSGDVKRNEMGSVNPIRRRKSSPTRKPYRKLPVVQQREFQNDQGPDTSSLQHSATRSTPDIGGLRKLSVSVRRGALNGFSDPDQNGHRESQDNVRQPSPRRSRSPSKSKSPSRRRQHSHTSVAREYESEDSVSDYVSASSASDDSDDNSNPTEREPKHESKRLQKKDGKKKKKKTKKKEKRTSDSDSEEESTKRKKTKDSKKGKQTIEKANETENKKLKSSENGKKVTRKNQANEKSIPFEKEHPKKKNWAKPAGVPDESSESSKEALAAAASGKKTPNMNPKFEVAPYEVHFAQQIGSGGFGVVFKAKFRGQTVAVKKIHAHALMNTASIAEFQSEVAVLCTLRHPNIIGFVGACTRPPNLMIITEFMARGTLFDILHQSNERVTWPMRKKFALDTCKGMRYLHNSKLLHRDLKSSNLLLDKDYNCKVGDFGLTRFSKGTAAMQMTGQCGTFQYMAVEVLANKPYSEKADVFSFGILLWEIVARKLPYFGMQPMQVGMAVLNQGLRPTIPKECPPSLAKLMRSCWDSDPSRRPSFSELVPILEALPE